MMNFRLARPRPPDRHRPAAPAAVDDRARREAATLHIGALITHHAVETATLPDGFAVLARAMRWVGHLPIRTRGTVGGSLAHADATAEWCLLAVLLDARGRHRGPVGPSARSPPTSFFHGFYATALEPDEV